MLNFPLKAILRMMFAVALLSSVVGCGQKGDLVRPGTPAAATADASSADR